MPSPEPETDKSAINYLCAEHRIYLGGSPRCPRAERDGCTSSPLVAVADLPAAVAALVAEHGLGAVQAAVTAAGDRVAIEWADANPDRRSCLCGNQFATSCPRQDPVAAAPVTPYKRHDVTARGEAP